MMWAALGREVEVGERFDCDRAGVTHAGTAWIEKTAGRYLHVCDCDLDLGGDGEHERTDPTTIFYERVAGKLARRKLGRTLYPRWKRRLALRAGIVEPPRVNLPLPASAAPVVALVHAGLIEQVQVRILGDEPDLPFPFSKTYAAEWCEGIDDPEVAKKVISALRRAGFLHVVDTTPTASGYAANLYVIREGAA